MNNYANIIKETQIEKTAFSNVLDDVYDAFLSYNDEMAEEINLMEMELILGFLEQQRKVVRHLLYSNKLKTRKQESEAIGFISKVDYLRETFDILQGKIKIEDIEAAAKTFAPKMQSSFEK
jgi:hypothetical protein